MFKQHAQFLGSFTDLENLPAPTVPEIALAGRSNVGKSSLINALCGRRKLAFSSSTPGRTQTLNVYEIAERLRLVDMPGYGYAKASRSDAQQWQAMMRDYLRHRATLRCVLLLVDARHGLKDSDRAMLALLQETAMQAIVILTKCDKIKKSQIAAQEQAIAQELQTRAILRPRVFSVSAEKATGIEALREALSNLL
ncbi:MAG: ribosome biogenesis GTP-binding protein YihA/YsxC [Alphaproteobacteria bacterium]|nr:ribosome biogenesis GTP-binding protein YihA/YsxC [Alphaproteobacteria bacterium]